MHFQGVRNVDSRKAYLDGCPHILTKAMGVSTLGPVFAGRDCRDARSLELEIDQRTKPFVRFSCLTVRVLGACGGEFSEEVRPRPSLRVVHWSGSADLVLKDVGATHAVGADRVAHIQVVRPGEVHA